MKKKLFSIIFIVATCSAIVSACVGPKGPLFVQTHFTSGIQSISKKQLFAILSGKITNFSQLGGENRTIELYVDNPIVAIIKNNFSAIKYTVVPFSFTEALVGNRSFLGISDVRGLRPYFKVLYINNVLPWGKINKKYELRESKSYSITMARAMTYDPKECISIVQTGVTAITRGVMNVIRRKKNIYAPIAYTEKITKKADLAITSNEVSFLSPCVYIPRSLKFCTPKEYFPILIRSGFDIIEITGNHNNDFGPIHNLSTINLIEKSQMSYFGGGKNIEDAKAIKYKKVKNHTLAFLGYNELGPKKAWATAKSPGALKLNKTLVLKQLKDAGKKTQNIFFTVQWGNENNPRPWKIQKKYFRMAADNGATIIVNSSAHRAMGLEFYKGKFISYGLGNFLFDQMHTINHRRGMIARHFFYKGKHIQTELIPYLIYYYHQPRIVYGKEAKALFNYVYAHSLGPVFK